MAQIRFYSLFLFLLVAGCKSSQQIDSSIDVIVSKEVGEGATVTKNSDETLMLAVAPVNNGGESPRSERQQMKYIVLKVSEKKVIYQGSFEAGYAQWIDNENIEVFSPPGIVRPGQNKNDLIKIINVNTKEKMSKTLYLATQEE